MATSEEKTFVLEFLKSAGIEVRLRKDRVTLDTDDLAKLIKELMNQHGQVHYLMNGIRELNPIVELFASNQGFCEDFHARWPPTPELIEAHERLMESLGENEDEDEEMAPPSVLTNNRLN